MSDLPYTYVDPNGDRLRVSAVNTITMWSRETPDDGEPLAGLWAPTGEDAAALARAVLANPGPGDVRYVVVPEWQVIDPQELAAEKRAYAEAAAQSMCDRVIEVVVQANPVGSLFSPLPDRIRALPLLPDATEGSRP